MKLLAIDAIGFLPSLGRREGRVAIFDRLCGDVVNKSIPPRNISYQGISEFTE
jgi:hypothetical protein